MNATQELATLAPPVLISTPGELSELAGLLLAEPLIAVDTESNSLYAYRERVCLIQFSTPKADYLVDPLAIQDLSPLGPVFASQANEKIFHAVEYDVICLKRDYGFQFNHLFDTMIASRILGRALVGLGDLLMSEFGIVHDKRFQRANWGVRPLTEELVDYARLDTHYLIPLRERLYGELAVRSLLPLAVEDFARLAKVEGNGRSMGDRPVEWWQIHGSNELDASQAAILQELCQFRDRAARALDRPHFKVMNDQTLVAIAAAAPQTIHQLAKIPGMTKGQVDRYGRQLLQAVQRGVNAKPLNYHRPARPDEAFLERLERLRRWRKEVALQRGVPSDVILPKDLLERLAEIAPASLEELKEVMQCFPWRFDQFGAEILKVVKP
jgi:ribonuclease D